MTGPAFDPPNWAAMESEDLFRAATNANEPSAADAISRTWSQGAWDLYDMAKALSDGVERLTAGWHGVAADSARLALRDLAEWGQNAITYADALSRATSQAAEAADEVRRLPPPAPPVMPDAVLAEDPALMTADLKAQQDARDAVKAEQVRYLDNYTAAMAAIDWELPSFEPPPTPLPHPDDPPGTPPGGGGGTGPAGHVRQADLPAGIPAQASGGPASATSTAGQPAPLPSSLLGGTRAQAGPRVRVDLKAAAGPIHPPTSTPPGPGGPGGGLFTGVPGPGGGPGAPQGGPVRPGAPGAPGARSAAGAGVAGRPMEPGGRGTGGAVPGRGSAEQEEDKVHQRPGYLDEDDPDELFGTDEPTAPPVIGG